MQVQRSRGCQKGSHTLTGQRQVSTKQAGKWKLGLRGKGHLKKSLDFFVVVVVLRRMQGKIENPS